MTVLSERHGSVAVLTLSNPPVNGMNQATRAALAAALDAAVADAAVQVILLTGAGRSFSGGADIREFGTPAALAAPNLRELIAKVEALPKPVVVALHGTVMGGGLELSLACHYRVAAPAAKLGLPEVKLGLLPGAGGTQRLPRTIGTAAALAMIVSGEPEAVERLAALPGQRLLDAVLPGAWPQVAIDWAAAHATTVSDRVVGDWPLPPGGEAELAAARARWAPLAADQPAPLACIDCVAEAHRPIAEGLAFEAEGFATLMDTAASRALRHAFFAERAAARIDGLPADTPTRSIRSVGVIGGGTMGSGIALATLAAGLPVTMVERDEAALAAGRGRVEAGLAGWLKKGRLNEQSHAATLARFSTRTELGALAEADLIIEAVYEDLGVKQDVFRALDGIAKPGAILATNTSTLDVDAIAAVTSRPADVIGLHFFSPANVMKLLEVVRAAATAPDVLATAMAYARALGKVAVVARVCDGFIGNRMIEQYAREAMFLLEEGARPEQIDAAIEAFGFAMGPFRMSDLAGNDIGAAIRARRAIEQPGLRYPAIADRLCALGRYGQKTSAGWYDYPAGERRGQPSALVAGLVDDARTAAGFPARDIPAAEIVERLMLALVNEGAKLLAEGIAQRASDIDVVYLYGYGFPAWRGGPMAWAVEVGLSHCVQRLRHWQQARPERAADFEPATLLVERAVAGGF